MSSSENFSAGLVAEINGKIIAVKDTGHRYPLWKFPAGQKKNVETPEECAVREALEEAGITAEPSKMYLLFKEGRNRGRVQHDFYLFHTTAIGFNPRHRGIEGGEKRMEVTLFKASEILAMKNFLPQHRKIAEGLLLNLARWEEEMSTQK